MYKICKTISYITTITNAYYILYNEDKVIKWFYMTKNGYISDIFKPIDINKLGSGNIDKSDIFLSCFAKECIYESSDLQEASDQLEQLRVLESV